MKVVRKRMPDPGFVAVTSICDHLTPPQTPQFLFLPEEKFSPLLLKRGAFDFPGLGWFGYKKRPPLFQVPILMSIINRF